MIDPRPGLRDRRLSELMQEAVERCRLDLSGLTVLTEAASGAYSVTPVLAALGGAERVLAMTRPTRYGTVDAITAETRQLARISGVEDSIEVITSLNHELIAQADLITNSGHVRPIDATMIASMKTGAVVALMYEGWEFRPDDLDLDACRRAGVPVGGTNERHPQVDVFSYLGLMAVMLLLEAGVAVYRSTILLLCDNPFRDFIEGRLRAAGAYVETTDRIELARGDRFDAVVVSLTPTSRPVIGQHEAKTIADRWPGVIVGQLWGDVDRGACASAGLPVWRPHEPRPGHMGILLSDLGPEPIVRLQSGGLKAGEALWRHAAGRQDADLEYVEILQATRAVQPPPCDAYC